MLAQAQRLLVASLFLSFFGSTLAQVLRCYLTGTTPLPKDVVTPEVKCAKPDTFRGIPDVADGALRFSQIDFRNFRGSPVGFALATFTLDKNDFTTLETASKLYDATGAALRSRNDIDNVKLIKGVQFFLAMQINRLQSNFALAQRNLGKTIKNCAKCSRRDRDQLDAIGKTFP